MRVSTGEAIMTALGHKMENQRLMALYEYKVLDTLPEQEFDDLVKLAQSLTQAPIALISLIDEKRQWFKAKVGLSAPGSDRDVSFCTHAIMQEEVYVIEDAQKNSLFKDNPFVTKEPYIRFYAGAPLINPEGHKLGTLCVIDTKPRVMSSIQLEQLQCLARVVVTQLELRKAHHKLENYQHLLSESSKMSALGEMAAGLAHEINNPLTIISGKVAQAKKKIENNHIDEETLVADLNKVEDNVIRISKISKSLKSYARNSKEDPEEDFFVEDSINQTLGMCSERFANEQIDLKIELNENPALKGHCDQLVQVFLNLLNNAHDAVYDLDERWVKIAVDSSDDKNQVIIRVSDSGKGITPEIQGKMGTPFFTTKAPGKGTGLGLGISKRIIKAHGGLLYYNDKAPSTEFVIVLPTQKGQMRA